LEGGGRVEDIICIGVEMALGRLDWFGKNYFFVIS